MRTHLLRHAHRDQSGVTIVEFGLVSPVLIMMLMGMFDVGHALYMTASLQGSVQKAARDSTLQSNDTPAAQAALDALITRQVKTLDSQAQVATSRRYFKDYNAAATPQLEQWSDTDKDGKCDHGEAFQDANGDGVWDVNNGGAGGGGAQDRTVYTVTVTYPRLFPFYRFVGLSSTNTLSATTVLANQPYGDQPAVPTGHCS